MKIVQTKFKGLCIVNGFSFYDRRGFFREIYKIVYSKNISQFFGVYQNQKKCSKRVAFTKEKSQAKFVSVLRGKILMLL